MNSLNNSSPTSGPTKEEMCQAPLEIGFIIQASVLILIMVVTFIGNLLVLLAVIFFRRLRSMTSYFIFSLAVSDLLLALLSLPFRIHTNFHNGQWCASMEACQTWMIIDSGCAFASMWNLVMISIDRFIVIKKPFHYQSIMTNKVGFGMITFVWTYSIVMALLMLLNWTNPGQSHFTIDYECGNRDIYYITVASSLSFFLPLLIIVVMYGMVFEVALIQTRAMTALQLDRDNNRGIGNPINLIREVKAAKTLAVVIGCFVICWLPFQIILMIQLWNASLIFKLPRDVRVFLSMLFIYLLPALNSTMNPIIYALLNLEFRSAFGKLTRRMTGRPFGAVGFNGTLDSTTGAMGASHAEQSSDSKDHVRKKSNNSTVSPSEDLPLYNTQLNKNHGKPVDNYLIVNADTNSMETSLDDFKRISIDNNITRSASNGHVITNQHVSSNVVSSDDVIDKQVSNDITPSDDVTEEEGEKTGNVEDASPQGPLSRSREMGGTLLSFPKTDTLSPVERNNSNTESDEKIVSSVECIKSLTVKPSPKLPIKGDKENAKNLDNSADII